jgi:hypothetical protein
MSSTKCLTLILHTRSEVNKRPISVLRLNPSSRLFNGHSGPVLLHKPIPHPRSPNERLNILMVSEDNSELEQAKEPNAWNERQ